MPRTSWKSKEMVRKSIETLTRIDRNGLQVPEQLRQSYKQMINSSSAELVALFFQGVAESCPQLLHLWAKNKEESE